MKTFTFRSSVRFVAVLLALTGCAAHAAIAPLSSKELTAQADDVVMGQVVEVSSKTQRAQTGSGAGIQRDRVFTITVVVKTVAKGRRIKPGEKIVVSAWQPATRIPPMPGLQGHEGIPAKGEMATFYLKKNAAGAYEPLLPNGIGAVENRGR